MGPGQSEPPSGRRRAGGAVQPDQSSTGQPGHPLPPRPAQPAVGPAGRLGAPGQFTGPPPPGSPIPDRDAATPDFDDDYPLDESSTGRGAALLLAGLTIVLLAVLPALFLIRDAARDPVYTGLDALAVPAWAKIGHEDMYSGNRYCVGSCRLRERVLQSARTTAETDAAYQGALREAGWLRLTGGGQCPTGRAGVYTCWQRDQYVLDLWTRDATCATSQAGGPNPGPSMVVPSNAMDTVPSAAPSVAPRQSGPVTAACPVSQVTVKVGNRADPLWHK
jgi:hypothetical protein